MWLSGSLGHIRTVRPLYSATRDIGVGSDKATVEKGKFGDAAGRQKGPILRKGCARRKAGARAGPKPGQRAAYDSRISAQPLSTNLLELGRNARKNRVQLGAKTGDDRDNGNGDTGRDEAVLDRRRSRLVCHKPQDKRAHRKAPWMTFAPPRKRIRITILRCVKELGKTCLKQI